MWPVRRFVLALVAAALVVPATAACTKSATQLPPTTTVETVTTTPDARPIFTGPTTAAEAGRCPLVDEQQAANIIGMRLERITVLHSGGKVVGCRIYALQGSPLHSSEHLPPANQPAIEIRLTRYRSALGAHNALVAAARAGSSQQTVPMHGTVGDCFQTLFYAKDDGQDWACGYTLGTTLVLVRTVVTSPALNAILLTRAVRPA